MEIPESAFSSVVRCPQRAMSSRVIVAHKEAYYASSFKG